MQNQRKNMPHETTNLQTLLRFESPQPLRHLIPHHTLALPLLRVTSLDHARRDAPNRHIAASVLHPIEHLIVVSRAVFTLRVSRLLRLERAGITGLADHAVAELLFRSMVVRAVSRRARLVRLGRMFGRPTVPAGRGPGYGGLVFGGAVRAVLATRV
jgi:hypothetical protein